MTAEIATGPRGLRDGRHTRDAVLRAASRLIRVRGYHGTSLDEILRESGVGKGNFYHHFRSKEDLGYAILDGIVAAFLEQTLDPCFRDAGVSPLDQVCCFLDRILAIQRERGGVGGCPLGNLASELADVHEGFRGRLASVFSAWRERLTGALEDARRRGLVTEACQSPAVAQFLVAGLEGAMLMTKLTKDVQVMEQCVEELKRHLALYRRAPEAG